MGKKIKLTPEREKELLGENFFYEHGLNPALKNLIQMQSENSYLGIKPSIKTRISEALPRKMFFAARDIKDYMSRDLNCKTIPTTLPWWSFSLILAFYTANAVRKFVPIGQFGIRRFNQTNAYKAWGYPGIGAAYGALFGSYYLLYSTSCFSLKMIYERAILQERNWMVEYFKYYNPHSPIHFSDTPLVNGSTFPKDSRILMAKNSLRLPVKIEEYYEVDLKDN